jgi:FdhE protein
VIEAIPGFLAWLRENGRSDFVTLVEGLDLGNLVASAFRRKAVAGGESENPAERFVIESLLQAFAEHLVNGEPPPSSGSIPMRCPRCAGPPIAAVLREEGHGAKRFLLCAVCLREWECLRIVCPACGEQEFDKLPVYTAEQFAHVRIDACDRCHHYVKTIDLTKDGLAVPCVDDLASVSLDLWAREQGYTRVKCNVLGI